MMTHVLANIFVSLFAKGFGAKEEDTDDANQDLIQDQSGTGMGEGSGINDVSDQINDEDQLMGTSTDVRYDKHTSYLLLSVFSLLFQSFSLFYYRSNGMAHTFLVLLL